MNFLNYSIKSKLLLLTLIPLIALISIVSLELNSNYTKIQKLEKLDNAVDLSVSITEFIHESQKERGATAGFIESNGKKFEQKLNNQKLLTDKKIEQLKEKLKNIDLTIYCLKYQKQVKQGLIDLDKLYSIRERVSSFNISSKEAITYYSNMHNKFLDSILILSTTGVNSSIVNSISAYLNFLKAKETAGKERAVGSATFAKDKFEDGSQLKFIELIYSQKGYIETFKKLASQENIDYFNKTLQGRDVNEVNRMRNTAINSKDIGGYGVDASQWFKITTDNINKLKMVENYVFKTLPKSKLNKIIKNLSNLIHEIQKERGLTSGFIGSDGKSFKAKLISQRKVVDKIIKNLKKSIKNSKILKNQLASTLKIIKKIKATRDKISKLNVNSDTAIKYYTSLNKNLIKSVFVSSYGLKSTIHNSYANLLLLKEKVGLERAVSTNIFTLNKSLFGMKERWIKLITEQDIYFEAFKVNASSKALKFYKKKMTNKNTETIHKMRKLVLNSHNIGGFNTDATYWFDTITKKINLLKNIDDYIANELIMQSKKIKDNSKDSFIFYSIIGILLIIISIFMLISITKNILNSISNLQNSLLDFFKYVNKEKANISLLDIKSKDEFGSMAKILNDNILKTKETIESENNFIKDVQLVMSKVEKGTFDKNVTVDVNIKSLHELKTTINNAVANLQNNIDLINNKLNEYSNYNYLNEINIKNLETDGGLNSLINKINTLKNSISSMLLENQKNGLKLDNYSDMLVKNVSTLSNASSTQAASLEETAASIEEITSSVKESTITAKSIENIANKTQVSLKDGKNLANKTVDAIEEINKSTSAIAEAITIIDQIAFQTNILSLNAAVEAATAGEAGKGFAVVAGEVRNLASKSSDAANEIKELVEKAKIKANEGTYISKDMIEGYIKLDLDIKGTNKLVDGLVTSSNEQLKSMMQINDAMGHLDIETQKNVQMANNINEIAKDTDLISQEIIHDLNNKEFNGKNNIN
jgi:methyl-accepting chemotaxis protein